MARSTVCSCSEGRPRAYPFLSVGSPESLVELDPHPKEGPPDAVPFTYRSSRIDSSRPQTLRYWIDPARSYLLVREEVLYAKAPGDAKGPPPRDRIRIVEQAAQGPNGVWYPTVIRDKGSWDLENNKTYRHDEVWRYYLDFGADMPDLLFQPPPPAGRGPE
jgi:hypothetical protein